MMAHPTNANPIIPGVAAIACFAAYAWQCVRDGKPANVLWACHLGCLLVGIGWMLGWPLAIAIGLSWLLPGIVLWAIWLAGGGTVRWGSLLTHVGGSALGVWGIFVLGFPTGAWWKAGLGWTALMMLARPLSASAENVNFSLRVWPGWEKRFPSYRRYVTLLVAGGFAVFLGIEWTFRQLLLATD